MAIRPSTFFDLLTWTIDLGNAILTFLTTIAGWVLDAALAVGRNTINAAWTVVGWAFALFHWVWAASGRIANAFGEHWGMWERPALAALRDATGRLRGAWRDYLGADTSGQFWPLSDSLAAKVRTLAALWSGAAQHLDATAYARAVGVRTAEAAELLLLDVETRTRDAFGLVRARVDGLAAWLNHGWDETGVLEERAAYWTLYAYAGHLWSVLVNSTLAPAPEPGAAAAPGPPRASGSAAATARFATDGAATDPRMRAALERFASAPL